MPMCVEEPSIVAACSGISKLIAKNGGFKAVSTNNIMTAQIQLLDINENDLIKSKQYIEDNETRYIDIANSFCKKMVKRKGGVIKISGKIVKPYNIDNTNITRKSYLVCHVDVNVCEAMGANIVNTIAEGLGDIFNVLLQQYVGLE